MNEKINFTCAHDLIDVIVEASVEMIKFELTEADPCCEQLLSNQELDKVRALTLDNIFDNQPVKILSDSENYLNWEKIALIEVNKLLQ